MFFIYCCAFVLREGNTNLNIMKYQKQQYCIVIDGKMQENTIKWSKQLCINDFIERDPFYSDWKYAYSVGFRCVKIKIAIERA